MRNWIFGVCVAVLTVVMCGCGPTFFSMRSALGRIEKGMDREEVTKLMGKPDMRRFIDNSEQWEYVRPEVNSKTNHAIITFEDDRVSSLDSFTSDPYEAPSGNTSPIVFPSPMPPYSNVISNDAYNALRRAVEREAFKEDKLKLIGAASIKRQFTCFHCAGLMALFPFDDERMKVLTMMNPGIVDRENYKIIIETLAFIDSQKKAKEMLLAPMPR